MNIVSTVAVMELQNVFNQNNFSRNSPFRYTSQITVFSRDCFLRHYGGKLKITAEQEAGKKRVSKR